jgi:hypothetical protein
MSDQVSSLIQHAISRWTQRGFHMLAAHSALDLRAFTEEYGVVLPDDFARYLLATGGMAEGEWDEHRIRFWPLSEITPLNSHLQLENEELSRQLFVLADHSVWAHAYAIRLSRGQDAHSGAVFLVGDTQPQKIAPTFTDFIQMYLYRPKEIFAPKTSE